MSHDGGVRVEGENHGDGRGGAGHGDGDLVLAPGHVVLAVDTCHKTHVPHVSRLTCRDTGPRCRPLQWDRRWPRSGWSQSRRARRRSCSRSRTRQAASKLLHHPITDTLEVLPPLTRAHPTPPLTSPMRTCWSPSL